MSNASGESGGLDVGALNVRFGERCVLDHFSLTVIPGELVVIMGESGSGKSTLLRAIAGLQNVESGTICIGGVDVRDVPTHKRRLGFVFQDLALFPHLNVAQNIAYGLKRIGMAKAERAERVGALLTLVGMPDAAQRGVTTLSGGEQQRVAVARALAPFPRLLLLDEPLTALDAERKTSLATELRRIIVSTQTTAIYVTHDRAEAKLVGSRIISMPPAARPSTQG